MTTSGAPRPIHVERTADPTVMRWVVHHRLLDTARPGRRQIPEGSPFGRLAADGPITDIAVRNRTVLVGVDDPGSWPQLAPRVQAALLEELDSLDQTAPHWLLQPVQANHRPLSLTELQQVVDRAAGAVMASHGGAMAVVAVDGGAVRVRSDGACTGCRHSDDTIVDLISPALLAAYPELTSVVVDHGGPHG